jgi:(2Fe-2S) ferredoxin
LGVPPEWVAGKYYAERAEAKALLRTRPAGTKLNVPQRKRYLFVCTNRRPHGMPKGSCATRGSEAIFNELKAQAAAKGLARFEVRICSSSCTDNCWAGPIIAVSPDGYFYGRVTKDDVPEILAALAEGKRVERLVLPPNDFDAATAGPMLPEHVPPPPASDG